MDGDFCLVDLKLEFPIPDYSHFERGLQTGNRFNLQTPIL